MQIKLTGTVLGPLGGTLGTLNINVKGTIGGLVGAAGSARPTLDFVGTSVAGLNIGLVLTPIAGTLSNLILPALVTPISNTIMNEGLIRSTLRPVVETALKALSPVFTQVTEHLLSVTVNVQESPGDFTTPTAEDADSYTERAIRVALLPNLTGARGTDRGQSGLVHRPRGSCCR